MVETHGGEGVGMDWIERIFHVSPDGGNGVTEFLILAGVVLSIAMVGMLVRRAVRRR